MIRTGLGLKTKTIEAMWFVARSILPQPVAYELWHQWSKRHRRTNLDTATGNRVLHPQKDITLEVYWSDVPDVGWGPSASLFVFDEEVLRVDCFGNGDGHMHLNPAQTHIFGWSSISRVRFPPGEILQQIDRGVFEITRNASAAAVMNVLRRVRKFRFDKAALEDSAEEMRGYMRELTEQYEASTYRSVVSAR